MEYYVVRIYRRSEAPAAEPVGVVELVETSQRVRFRSFAELVGILRGGPAVRVSKRRATRHG